jgi:predicted permease
MWRALMFRLRSLFSRQIRESDLDAELNDHLAQQTAWHVAHGAPPDLARRQARLDLGDLNSLKEQCRDSWTIRWAHDAARDVTYALRVLRKSPGFLVATVVSLTLGIGANAVVFGILNGLLLKPLPIPQPDRLVAVEGIPYTNLSFPNYQDLRDRATNHIALAASRIAPMGLTTGDSSDVAWGYLVTGNYFDVLGVAAWRGRLFTPADDSAIGANRVVVLGFEYWQNHFRADSNIVGRPVRINTSVYTVVGILPPRFYGTERFYRAQLFVPMSMQPEIDGTNQLQSRAAASMYVVGRLRPGVTASQTTAALNVTAADLARLFPRDSAGLSVRINRVGWLGLGTPVSLFARGLMGLGVLVLLAACANLAALLLVRATDRHREIGIRLAIGADRGRIIRQLLTEVAVLTSIGGTCASLFAVAGLSALSRWRAPLTLPIQLDLTADWRVLMFAAAVTGITAALCGLTPSRTAWRLDLVRASRGAEVERVSRRWTLRDLLVLAQVAICCLLLLATAVAVRGLSRALAAPLGMRLDGVDVAGADLAFAKYSRQSGRVEDGRVFQRRVLDEIRQLPGVVAAAYSSGVPLNIDQSSNSVFPEQPADAQGLNATLYAVSPGYFATMGTRLVGGRDFSWTDDAQAPRVAIVNQQFARLVLGQPNAIGSRFRYSRNGAPVTVIGIVEDGKYVSLVEDPRPAVFQCALQNYYSNTDFLVRRADTVASVAQEIRRIIARRNPDVPVYTVGAAADVVDFAFLPVRAATIAIVAFGALAAMLALTGINGVAAYSVSRRTREIGIRVAIGARASQIVRTVLGRVIVLVLLGTTFGMTAGVVLVPLLRGVVYGSASPAIATLATAVIGMLIVGSLAAWVPARRALTIEPVKTLRMD